MKHGVKNAPPSPRKNREKIVATGFGKGSRLKAPVKMTAKQFLLLLPVQFLIAWACQAPQPLAAQGTLNALTYDSGVAVVGYVPQGVGWSFVPTADNINILLLGPNFQFQVVPEPGGLELLLLAAGACLFRRNTGANSRP